MKVFKIGGNVVDCPEALESFCREFAAIEGPKVLVHGGGVVANQIQKALGQEPVKIAGRRVTDWETLKVVTMVYAGWCNKNITALLQREGCNAIGLSGCDANAICASRRAPLLIDGHEIDFGAVGDVDAASVNTDLFESLCSAGLTPVVCAINHDGKGNLLNTNADTIASSIAVALKAELVYCFEKNGVLMDRDDEDSVIRRMDPSLFGELQKKGIIADGMIPKVQNAFKALREGASSVVIRNSANLAQDGGTRFVL